MFINNIESAKYIYDPKEFKNILYSKNNIFNLPYSMELSNNEEEKKLNSKINIEKFKSSVRKSDFVWRRIKIRFIRI